MKRIIPTLVLGCMLLGASLCRAQQQSTSIVATISAEKQTVRTGPYARFAQKFLGVIAPLSDKETYTIISASIAAVQSGEVVKSGIQTIHPEMTLPPMSVSQTRSATDFVKVPVDRKDFIERSLEEAAREAAATLFSIRKHRMELVTGVSGENVFGEGLSAALAELNRLEEEYLALFMGKQSQQTIVRNYEIIPQAGESSRIVCRFAPNAGLLGEDDLSGSPVVLEMKVGNKPAPAPVIGKRDKNAPAPVYQYLPAAVNCRLLDGKNELARRQMQIYQMGTLTEVPTPER